LLDSLLQEISLPSAYTIYMMSLTSISVLPEEMMMRIFELVPPQDLRNVVLVSKQWREMGEHPSLWTETKAIVNTKDDFKMFHTRRFQWVKDIKVRECNHWKYSSRVQCCYWTVEDLTELFKILLDMPTVIKIHSEFNFCINLLAVEPNLLVRVFTRLEDRLYLDPPELSTPEQVQNILAAIAAEKTKLKRLQITEASEISPELFAAALTNVDNLEIISDGITTQQMEALFIAISEEETHIRKLVMSSCDTYYINPDLLSAALYRLEEVETSNMWVNKEQIMAVLRKVVDGEGKLQKLMFQGVDYSDYSRLDPDLVRNAWEKIGEFFTDFDTDPNHVVRPWYSLGSRLPWHDPGSEYDVSSEDDVVRKVKVNRR